MTTNITHLNDLTDLEFSAPDRSIIANALNIFGSGDHPMAKVDNLNDFAVDYILKCLDSAIEKTITEGYKIDAIDLWCSIHVALEEVPTAMHINTE